MTHPTPTHPPTPSVPGPSKFAAIFAVGVAIGFGLVRRLTRKAAVR